MLKNMQLELQLKRLRALERSNLNTPSEPVKLPTGRGREFRDAITKAGWIPSIPGMVTQAIQWNRWSP